MNVELPSPPAQQHEVSPTRRQLLELLNQHDTQRRRERGEEQAAAGADDALLLVLGLSLAVFLFFLLSSLSSASSAHAALSGGAQPPSPATRVFGTAWPSREIVAPAYRWLTAQQERALWTQWEDATADEVHTTSRAVVARTTSPLMPPLRDEPIASSLLLGGSSHSAEENPLSAPPFDGSTAVRGGIAQCSRIVPHTQCGDHARCNEHGRCELSDEHCQGVYRHRSFRSVRGPLLRCGALPAFAAV